MLILGSAQAILVNLHSCAPVAQWIERSFPKRKVPSSTLGWSGLPILFMVVMASLSFICSASLLPEHLGNTKGGHIAKHVLQNDAYTGN